MSSIQNHDHRYQVLVSAIRKICTQVVPSYLTGLRLYDEYPALLLDDFEHFPLPYLNTLCLWCSHLPKLAEGFEFIYRRMHHTTRELLYNFASGHQEIPLQHRSRIVVCCMTGLAAYFVNSPLYDSFFIRLNSHARQVVRQVIADGIHRLNPRLNHLSTDLSNPEGGYYNYQDLPYYRHVN